MAKNLGILIITLLLNLTIFSQKDTSKICFDYKIAKQIALDLTRGDSAIAELTLTNKLVDQLHWKIDTQDSIIKIYVEKETNYVSQINNYAAIQEKQSVIVKGLEGDVDKLNTQNNNLKKGLRWVSSGFAVTLTSLILLLSIK